MSGQSTLPKSTSETPNAGPAGVYPGLGAYMGLELSEDTIRANMPEYLPENQNPVLPRAQVRTLY